jgi:PAS domain S-box-containing protein
VSREITERKRAEDHAAHLARSNELLLTCAAEGIFGIDLQGRITFINPAGARMLGRDPQDLLGREEHSAIHHTRADGSTQAAPVCAVCAPTRDRLVHRESDDVFWRPDGSCFDVEYVSTPIIESGGLVGAVVTFRDVSDRKRAEREMRHAKEAAEAANRAKSDFLARMSHELRTPLNAVIGFANLAQKNKGQNLSPQDLLYLDRIASNGRHLLGLINDILDLSKVEAGKSEVELKPVDVGALVQDVVNQLGGRQAKEGVTLTVLAPAGMAPLDTDPAKLRQILINLLSNAVKFTAQGTVTVTIEADRVAHPTAIKIADTGVGVPPDRQRAIFEPFEQADTSTTRQFGGTGLGLSICRALCELLGFRIGLESIAGVGSTFTVDFTAHSTDLASGGPARNGFGSAASSAVQLVSVPDPVMDLAPSGGRLILVIDDEPDARLLLTENLQSLGYRAIAAASGAEGLQLARRLRPDLITLDLMMPGMSGWEVLKHLSAEPELCNIAVVIVSAVDVGDRRNHFLGVVDFVTKPIDRGQLAATLQKNLAGHAPSVLIVEDDPDAGHLLTQYVREAFGCVVHVATNGQEALEAVATHVPELIVLDVYLPVMNGVSFLRSIRQIPRYARIPVIAVTAHTLSRALRAYLREETLALLEKGEELEPALREHLELVFGKGTARAPGNRSERESAA